MAVVLPPAAAGMMQLLGPWPNIDEDDVRAEGNAARTAQAVSAPAAGGADAAVRGAQQVYRGDSAAMMESTWNRTGAQGGHVAQANQAMRVMPAALDGTASVVSAVKVAAGTQAVFTAVGVAKALAFGGAVGATVATARVLASRQAVRKILREGSEGTGKVIAPIVRRRVTEPMRRILDDLRRPGGTGGPRLATAGGRGAVPVRTSGLRNPSGPRSVEDGIARMGRRNNRDNNRGRGSGGNSRGGGGFFSRNSNQGSRHDGRIHGDPPTSARGMSEAEAKKAEEMLKKSIKARKAEEDRKGYEVGHAERIRREERALKDLQDSIRRKQYDSTPDTSSSGGTYNSGSSQASADRYPTDAEWEQQKKNRRW
ncbi:hypothetical protein FXF51_08180 [Nonomuraea sp. PA05]|uniref:hypothetical protein n=1 Tax=Nonomuraea sp. PA05 TaxID=2604466 RepID=UPI0011D3F99E|nr:hypothetical protein [Nonomuraea sp. PA05]TYB69206.1 hypothetical protein FXF51_08180 [Nonomuraea sp. PA05]